MSVPQKVLPGQPIVPIITPETKYFVGRNCRIETIKFNGSEVPCIVSSVVGRVKVVQDKDGSKVDVISRNDPGFSEDQASKVTLSAITPKLHDIVLARVTKISNIRANVEILSIDDGQDTQLMQASLAANENGEKFKGIVRSLDVRSTERDKVKIYESFQPGEVIRAEIISLGDGVNYYLSTARNDLGVVLAEKNGEPMYAIDWETMVVPSTGAVEKRKCAKPYTG